MTWAGSTGTAPCGNTPTSGTLTAAQYSQGYSYDMFGRLTSGPLGSYTYGDPAHVHGATSIGSAYTASYDASGNLTCRAHGAHAPPQASSTPDETIQMTTNHPWLTADHGWILASFLRVGEPVQRVDGSVAVVVGVRSEPGTVAMWDLTVSNVHTFAVGAGEYVVHNCGQSGKPDPTKLGSGQNYYYEGQQREGLQQQRYRQNHNKFRDQPNKSQAFRDFIKSRKGSDYVFNDNDWRYKIETWEGGGKEVYNHYWQNGDEFWHHHER
ncbi:MAG TPA: Hint domain-containing protein [Ktedonobacterales bacterium]|nr:Hint domain-containing protein [Ktedonobacterales bacterium]